MAQIDLALSAGFDSIRIDPILIFTRNDAFENAPEVVAQQAGLFFESIKDEISESVRGKMREWRGNEKRDVNAVIYPGIYDQVSLIVGGDLVQTYVDEFGLPARKCFPPFGKDSILFQWVVEVLAPQPLPVQRPRVDEDQRLLNAQLSATFAVALAINQRGLPAPADYLHQPFKATFEEFLPRVLDGLLQAGLRAASIINTGNAGTVEFVVEG
jgi:hypothetical protein